jgi:EAL domain-containing protein (putative c-di-GMP-specific phosphodiesterase class I)/GGDEF domain-containing protein
MKNLFPMKAGGRTGVVAFGSAKSKVRAKAIALIALAVVPAPLALVAVGAPPLLVAACVALSLFACALAARLLRPIGRMAGELEALMLADGADAAALADADDFQRIARGIAHLDGRVHSMQHRWSWRHAVTGLPVRETLIKAIAQDLASSDQPGLLGAIRFVDFDRLAAFDPESAEAALQRFSERLTASLGRTRPVAHVDRDSFAIWFRNTDPAAADVELRALCYALGAELKAGDLAVLPEVEVGTACFPTDGLDPAALINRALVSFARPGAEASCASLPGKSAESARERFSLEQDLRHAIDRGQFEMVFQPVVDLSKGVVGAEALLRWRHPEAGMISPARFIPILEDADLIDEIGRWTLNTACREMRRWRQRGLTTLKVAVNLSAAQLRDPTLKQTIQRTLERHRLNAAALELELTETAATEDAERTHSLFGELRALGVSLAIDDFGSGYSSLSYLKNLPFDKLKVDREFVVDVHLRKDSQAICRSLVALTRGLDLQILAEGVESWDEVAFLEGLGCQIFQGFVFSRPLNSDQFVEFASDPQWRGAVRRPGASPGEVEKRMSA